MPTDNQYIAALQNVSKDRVGLGIVGIFFGAYLYPPVLNGFGELFDGVFGLVDAVLPFYLVIVVLAVVSGGFSAGMHRVFDANGLDTTNKDRMKELHRRRLEAEAAGDSEQLQSVYDEQADVMSEEFDSLKEQFRPFIWALVGSMPVFIWIYWKVSTGLVATGEETLVLPGLGATKWGDAVLVVQTWLVWYFVWSVIANQFTRRLIRFQKRL